MHDFIIRIRIKEHATFWEYAFQAKSAEYAINHLDAIKSGGFTNVNADGEVEYFAPSQIAYIKLKFKDNEQGFIAKYPAKKILP